jgi:hypothetical protein
MVTVELALEAFAWKKWHHFSVGKETEVEALLRGKG